MRNHLLLLLLAASLMSCTKTIIEVNMCPAKADSTMVKKDTTTTNSTVTITKDVNDAVDRVVQGSLTSPTTLVTVATFDVAMQGSKGGFHTLQVHVAATNTGTGFANANSVVTLLHLYNSAGQQIDAEIVPPGIYPVVTFQNLNTSLPAGTTTVFTIKADIAAIDGTAVTSGANVQINITPADVSNIQVTDKNNVMIGGSNLIGSTVGSKIFFYPSGIVVNSIGNTTNYYQSASASQTHGTFSMNIPFSVTAYGTSAYIPSTAVLATAAGTSTHIQFGVDNGTAITSGATAVISYSGIDAMTVDANGNFMIPVGQTKNFVLTVTFTPSGSGVYRASLLNVNFNLTDSGIIYMPYTAGLNAQAFKTAYVSGQ